MLVKFLREFGGRETKEIHYPAGFEVELDEDIAEDLVKRGICIEGIPGPETVTPEPTPEAPKPATRKGKLK